MAQPAPGPGFALPHASAVPGEIPHAVTTGGPAFRMATSLLSHAATPVTDSVTGAAATNLNAPTRQNQIP